MANFPSSSLEPGMSGSQVKQLQQYLICEKCGKKYRVPKYRINKSKTCCKKCHNSISGRIGGKKGKGVSRNKGAKRPDLSLWNKTHRNYGEKSPN